MERLTIQGNFCDIAQCTTMPCDGACDTKRVYERLRQLEDLQEQGRLVELSCKVGDIVYSLWSRVDSKKQYIRQATVTVSNFIYYIKRIQDGTSFIFRNEAQAALDRMEEQE